MKGVCTPVTDEDNRENATAPLFVHLSDIHFDAKDNTLVGPNAVVREALMIDLAEGAARLGKPDAVLVTGDIAFSGQEHEYLQARKFLQSVTDILGIDQINVLVVPGNHDVNRGLVTTSVQMLHDKLRSLSALEADIDLQNLFKEPQDPLFTPMAAYQDFAAGFNCNVWGDKPAWEVEFPLGQSAHIKMRGITTTAVSDKDDERGRLIVGTGQTTFATGDPRAVGVLLGHHPTDWWLDYDECEQHMRNWVSVHFLGHKHVSQVSTMNDSIRVVAGAVHPERHIDWLPGYNWVRMNINDEFAARPRLQIEVWSRRFPPSRNQFVSDTESGPWEPDVHVVRLPRWEKHNEIAALSAERKQTEEEGGSGLMSPTDGDAGAGETPIEVEDVTAATGAEDAVSHRGPLADAEGRPQRLRTAIYRFGALGYADQQRLLVQFNLVEDGDEQLRVDEARLRSFERLGASERIDEFIEAIQNPAKREGQ